MELEVRVEPEALHFVRYPFWPASVRKRPVVAVERFTGWNPRTFPPSLLLASGEVLYVPASKRGEVHAWALAEGVRTWEGPDNWALLLEPFLDTEFTGEQAARTEAALALHGFGPDEVSRWRERVRRPMLAANSLWWEWGHLGHFDALTALQSFSAPWTFRRFYWDSMEVVLRGAARSSGERPTA